MDTPRSNSGDRTKGETRSTPPKKKRRRRRNGLRSFIVAILYVLVVVGISAALAAGAWICAGDVLALNKPSLEASVTLTEDMFTEKVVSYTVKNEDGSKNVGEKQVNQADMDAVAKLLKTKGIIQYEPVFKLFCKLSKADTKLAPGSYELNTDMDYRAIVNNLSARSVSKTEITVTIPEGYTVRQIFELLEERGVCSVAELNETAANHDYKFSFLEGIPLGDPQRLEGYLFPDTYRFFMGEDPLYAINKMLVNFSVMVPQEMRDKITQSGKTLHEIITVASLIEKETDGTDMPVIASVIYNRLAHPEKETAGYLQIDATLAYLNGGKVPTEADKAIDSPYNTYLYKGLPPAPIANPGSEAIWSAMNPKSSSYYYYALGKDGLHHFSKTYREHQKFLDSLPKD